MEQPGSVRPLVHPGLLDPQEIAVGFTGDEVNIIGRPEPDPHVAAVDHFKAVWPAPIGRNRLHEPVSVDPVFSPGGPETPVVDLQPLVDRRR